MGTHMDFETARALLAWQVELGATEAICDAPIDRYALQPPQPKKPAVADAPPAAHVTAPAVPVQKIDPVALAKSSAQVDSITALRAALDAFEECDLKKGARQLVFADGTPGAQVMIIGDAPGRDDDEQGKPFMGREGQLLDKMLAAIGLDRAATDPRDAVYLTHVLPWRPPQGRDPRPEELAMMMPFLERHVALAAPQVIIAMGNVSCQALLGRKGISRLRGNWAEVFGKPCLPMLPPSFLLRTPVAKRDAWADLIALRDRLHSLRSLLSDT